MKFLESVDVGVLKIHAAAGILKNMRTYCKILRSKMRMRVNLTQNKILHIYDDRR